MHGLEPGALPEIQVKTRYPLQADGKVLFPFRRMFIIATIRSTGVIE
jgi:hypothetical protein